MRDKIKRFLAAGMAVLVLAAAAVPVDAAAAGRSDPNMISIPAVTERDLSKAVERVAEGVFAHQEEIDLTDLGLDQEESFDVIKLMTAKYPEIFFLDRKVPASLVLRKGKLLKVRPKYLYSKEETDKKLAEFYAEADRYLSLVSGNMTALEKALVLHDAIIDDSEYVIDDKNNSDYGLLVEKLGVCENYARVYGYLLGKLGIRSEIVDSDKMDHEWIKINIGGAYYHVDITWDDPLPGFAGRVDHKFFLLSDDKISDSSYYDPHEDFKCINDSWSKTYDGGVMQTILSKCCAVDGRVYCIYGTPGNYNFGTLSFREGYDTAALSFSPITSLYGKYWHSGDKVWDANCSGLLEYKGRLIYNVADEIFSYDPKTGRTESVYKLPGGGDEIYGIKIRDDKVYGMMARRPVDKGEEKELCSLKKKPFAGFKKQIVKLSKKRFTFKFKFGKNSLADSLVKAFSQKKKK